MKEINLMKEDFQKKIDEIEEYTKPNFYQPCSWDFLDDEESELLEEPMDKKEDIGFFKMVKNNINRRVKKIREEQYFLLKQKPGAIRIVSEGDSWFQHPFVHDIIDYLIDWGYAMRCFSDAGDQLANMVFQSEFLEALKTENPRLFLLSGGGNDFLAPSVFETLVMSKAPYLIKDKLEEKMVSIKANIEALLTQIHGVLPELPVLMHGYDYVIPSNLSLFVWIYPVLVSKGITERQTQKYIVQCLIDRFNEVLIEVEKNYPGRFYYTDIRGTVFENEWYDEIHPNDNAFERISEKVERKIREILKNNSHTV
ncbi:MAG TPA: hypothetical protein DHW82_03340 [Spirochaetia bacterium]|nr:hypothetical protein [Spirochaetia bacterium]